MTPRQDMEAGVSVRAMVEKLEASSRITEGLGCASAQNLGSKRPAPPMLPAVLDKDELLCMELEKDKHESQEVLSEKRPGTYPR